MSLQIHDEAGVRRIRLVRGRGNALDEATLEALAVAFAEAGAVPVLLLGRGRSFCTGLDLAEAAGRDRPAMARLMEAFHRALCACFLHPAPVVAALNGHALAGGALLALACDHRRLARGTARFGIHGVHLGVSYPQAAVEILRHQLPRRRREEILYAGRILDGGEALSQGLVDALDPPEALEERALAAMEALREGGDAAYALAKSALRAPARRRLLPLDEEAQAAWLDQWFRPETRRRVGEATRSLTGGGGAKPGTGQEPPSGRV